ncbi:hypothetical protein [Acinetobacter sp. TSRC1-2]|uniref:hypothetical protein n=1 Tax=unclassified Acinetobacter TaxID=196816 RepID=UPI003CFB29C8
MRLTSKQIEILQKVESGNLDGSLIDLTQLKQSLSYTATKQAVLCSINHLAKRDLIERIGRESRNGSLCTTLTLTSNGKALLNTYAPSLKSVLIEADEQDFDKLDRIFI